MNHVVYAKIETELSWPIEQDVFFHENYTRQRCDWS